MPALKSTAITPSAARLTESLRDIGYDFPSAVADIVDNSIMAGATRVEILIEFDGPGSSVTVSFRRPTVSGLTPRRPSQHSGWGLKTTRWSPCAAAWPRASMTATILSNGQLSSSSIGSTTAEDRPSGQEAATAPRSGAQHRLPLAASRCSPASRRPRATLRSPPR